MFWTIAAAVLFAAAALTLSPLLRTRSAWQALAIALIFLLPAGAFWLYQGVGTPAAIHLASARPTAPANAHTPGAAEIDSMIASLQAKLAERPDDLDGWMLLARTLKATQQFPQALEALEHARRLAPDNPFIAVDLLETQIYLSPEGTITAAMTTSLEQALEVQPDMEKALWLLGIGAAQAGDDTRAIAYWESLLGLVEPGSSVAASVQSQVDAAKARLGLPADANAIAVTAEHPADSPDDGSWPGIRVIIKAGTNPAATIPAGGVLYVIIRSASSSAGPPVGVRRIIGPQLPLEMTITDQDSMIKERQISTMNEVSLQARISLTGSPSATTGDWQSAPTQVTLDEAESIELVIDQRVD